MELGTGILWAVYGCRGSSRRNQGPVERDFWREGSQETTGQAGKDVLGRMNGRHEDRRGGIGDNDSHLRA